MKLHKYGWLLRSPTCLVALLAALPLHRGVDGEEKWEKVIIYFWFVY